jgi:hypothetical protein
MQTFPRGGSSRDLSRKSPSVCLADGPVGGAAKTRGQGASDGEPSRLRRWGCSRREEEVIIRRSATSRNVTQSAATCRQASRIRAALVAVGLLACCDAMLREGVRFHARWQEVQLDKATNLLEGLRLAVEFWGLLPQPKCRTRISPGPGRP